MRYNFRELNFCINLFSCCTVFHVSHSFFIINTLYSIWTILCCYKYSVLLQCDTFFVLIKKKHCNTPMCAILCCNKYNLLLKCESFFVVIKHWITPMWAILCCNKYTELLQCEQFFVLINRYAVLLHCESFFVAINTLNYTINTLNYCNVSHSLL